MRHGERVGQTRNAVNIRNPRYCRGRRRWIRGPPPCPRFLLPAPAVLLSAPVGHLPSPVVLFPALNVHEHVRCCQSLQIDSLIARPVDRHRQPRLSEKVEPVLWAVVISS